MMGKYCSTLSKTSLCFLAGSRMTARLSAIVLTPTGIAGEELHIPKAFSRPFFRRVSKVKLNRCSLNAVEAVHWVLEGKFNEVVNASAMSKFLFRAVFVVLDCSSFAYSMKCMDKMEDDGADVVYIIGVTWTDDGFISESHRVLSLIVV